MVVVVEIGGGNVDVERESPEEAQKSRLVGRTWGGLPNGIIDPTPESGGALPAASLESMNALLAYAAENNKARESSAALQQAAEETSPFNLNEEDVARFDEEIEFGRRNCPSASTVLSLPSPPGVSSIGGEEYIPDDHIPDNQPMFVAPGKPACVPSTGHDTKDGSEGAAKAPAAEFGGSDPHVGGPGESGSGSGGDDGGGGREGRHAAKEGELNYGDLFEEVANRDITTAFFERLHAAKETPRPPAPTSSSREASQGVKFNSVRSSVPAEAGEVGDGDLGQDGVLFIEAVAIVGDVGDTAIGGGGQDTSPVMHSPSTVPVQEDERALRLVREVPAELEAAPTAAKTQAIISIQAWQRGQAGRARAVRMRTERDAATAAAERDAAARTLQEWQRSTAARVPATEERALRLATGAAAWWQPMLARVLLVAMLVGTGAFLVALASPMWIPCGRTSVGPGSEPLGVGECVQGGKGSRLFGGLPGIKWKPRITIGEVGGTFFGPDGVEVALNEIIPETKGRGGHRGFLCSAETMLRKLPFIDALPENRAAVRGDQLVVGRGIFCTTHRTPPLPRRSSMFGRGGGTIARFSDSTGELNLVDERGKVLWSSAVGVSGDGTSTSNSSSSGGGGRDDESGKTVHRWWKLRWWGRGRKGRADTAEGGAEPLPSSPHPGGPGRDKAFFKRVFGRSRR